MEAALLFKLKSFKFEYTCRSFVVCKVRKFNYKYEF